MPVRSRFVPRTQSSHVPFFSESSLSIVICIAAILMSRSTFGPYSFRRECFASSVRPCRANHQGDSGAKIRPTAKKAAKKSWIANGPLYAQRSVRPPNPLITPLEISCPMAIPRLTPAVEMPRRTTGVICRLFSMVPATDSIGTYFRATERSQCQVEAQAQTKD